MIRTIPYGVRVGQIIVPLVAVEMTNGKMAVAKARYEVRVIYPGGVIIRSAKFSGAPLASGDDEEVPGGLLRSGTPVHVEGEELPTDEELARFVNAGVLGLDSLPGAEARADALDFASPGVWDYRIDPTKRVSTPRQASVVCDILIGSGKTEFSESEILTLVRSEGARLNTKQDPGSVFKYYRSNLSSAGFLVTRK